MIRETKQWRHMIGCCAVLTLAALIGAIQPSVAAGQDKPVLLARMNGIRITSDELAQKASERRFLRDDPYSDPAVCKPLLDDIILDTLVSMEARRIDLSSDYDFRARLRIELVNAALQAYQRVYLVPSLTFDSATVDSYYNAHVDRYTAPRDQRKIRQITVYKKGYQIPKNYITYVDPIYEGWDPKRKIDSIYTRLANGEDFEALVVAHSEELKAKASKGNLGWLSPAAIGDTELVKPFFETPLHMISRPFETDYAWIIVQATDERKAGPAPIDDIILTDIIYGLQQAKGKKIANALTDSVVNAGTLEYNDLTMNAPDSLISPGDAMAIINKKDTLWGAGYKYRKHQLPDVRTLPYLSREKKEEILKPLVRTIFLGDAMRQWGYMDFPEVNEIRRRKVRQYSEELVRATFTTSEYAPDSAAIEAYYHDHIAEFTPERRHQLESVRLTDRDSARQVLDAWRQGTRPAGVQAQMVGPSDLPAPVWNKLAAVTPGSYVGPVGANGVYWVMHLNRILPPRSIKDVWATIDATMRNRKRNQLQADWLRKMAQRYNLVRYDERLRQVVLPSRHDPRFAPDTTAAAM